MGLATKHKNMRKLYLFLKISFYLMILMGVGGVVGLYSAYLYFAKDLPKINSLKDYNPSVVSEVFAADGQKIGEFWEQRRIVLKPDEIPRLFRDAIIASEDQRFFEHSGIDYFGVIRAGLLAIKDGEITQGASTITQQVARNFFLSNEKTAARKIKEAILAKDIEDALNKEEILYLYLNQIYLGNRAYGIEAAAQNYFHKSARDLDLAETAIVVALAKGGGYYDPTLHFDRAKERQEYVLRRMLDVGMITEVQFQDAKNKKIILFDAPTAEDFNKKYAPWFVEEVRKKLVEKYGSQFLNSQGLKIETTLDLKAQKFADQAMYQGLSDLHKRHGYNGVIKTLKPDEFLAFQKQTQTKLYREQVDVDWIPTDASEAVIQSAVIPLNPDKVYQGLITAVTTNDITVQVGNITGKILKFDYGWARKRSTSNFGYIGVFLPDATKRFAVGDVIEVKSKNIKKDEASKYPEGSTYLTLEEKPEVEGALFSFDPTTGYVKAIVGGKNFASSEFNRATQALRQTGSSFKPLLYAAALDKGYTPDFVVQDSPFRVPDGNGYWEPKNAGGGYRGAMALKDALAQSRNVVSAKLILDVGVDYVTAMVRKLGISTKINKVYSMSLGSNEMHLSELTRAFGVFPTGGILPDVIYYTKITDRYGSVLETHTPKTVENFVDQIKTHKHQGQGSASIDPNSINKNLREDLWTEAQYWMQKDKLDLSPFEKIILYGKYIPEGYVISPKTAFEMIGMMRGVVEHGTAWRAKSLGREIAGKTGTTNDNSDTWFVGFMPNLVTGIWAGYDNHAKKLGSGEEGGTAAVPIFVYYLDKYLAGTPKLSFNPPPEIESELLAKPVVLNPGEGLQRFGKAFEGGGGADIFTTDI